MQTRADMMNKAGGVLAAGTKSGTILDHHFDVLGAVDVSDSLSFSSFWSGLVDDDSSGVGSKSTKTAPTSKQTAANVAACSYVDRSLELANGPIMNAKPAAIPNFPTLPARSAELAESP